MSEAAAHDTNPTYGEMIESLTGFDEIAIEKHMGVDIYDVVDSKHVLTHRLLVFVHLTRQGKTPAEAVTGARSMTVKEVVAYFADDPEEVDEEEPETPEGKEPTPVGSAPASSPTSA